jgi:tetratricopeptide (TPR) repeat protein
MRFCDIQKEIMKKFKFAILAVLCLSGGTLLASTPVAGTSEEMTSRLQRAIDRASEQGNYSHVQSLRIELAHHYASLSQYALAARQYELILASRPRRKERVSYFIELGKMLDADQDYNGAIQAYQDALHDDVSSWEASINLARSYDHADLNSKSIDMYKHCTKLRPNSPDPYVGIAHVYQQLGFLNKAVANYQKALSLEKRPELYLALADTYARQGDIVRAKEILQQAKAVLPRADYDVRLGEIYRRQGDLSNACAAWEEALKSDPHRDDVRLQLALGYDHIGRPSDSDRLLTGLLKDYPASPLIHYSRAWVLYARGDRTGSLKEAQTVLQLGPTTVIAHFNNELLTRLKKNS